MKKITLGILAHVDAGKTTLTESMLYNCGVIRKQGRVDNKDTFLDTYAVEKERGITVFSKQAIIEYKDMEITLIDTPGHVDFSAEMERTLAVLDYGILVISGTEGVQSHVMTLWNLLKIHNIPLIVFFNKMDRSEKSHEELIGLLNERLKDNFIDFSQSDEKFYDELAMCHEGCMDEYLESNHVSDDNIADAVAGRALVPCYFGSALKSDGVKELVDAIYRFTKTPDYGTDFAAKVFKILKDEKNERLTFMKITGGCLRAKALMEIGDIKEKADNIRIYSGSKYTLTDCAGPGTVCAVTGLKSTRAGMSLGCEQQLPEYIMEPVIRYSVLLPEKTPAANAYAALLEIGQEIPELNVSWDEQSQNIQVKVMGQVQAETFKQLVKERTGMEIDLGSGNIVYKETIEDTVHGAGHFEPLRHYAEVHIIMEPEKRGSGLSFCTECSEDELALNWQRLILTHMAEKQHKGVLTGSDITDIKITLIAGKAHKKHTEGGDFRQALYRAVRQGLMQAKSILLEPYYAFKIEVPMENTGKLLSDMTKMSAEYNPPETIGSYTVITGKAPVSEMMDYGSELLAYTHGEGKISLMPGGYDKCHNEEEVIKNKGYSWENDVENTPDSVFCASGAGFIVPWNEVSSYMHLKPLSDKEDYTEYNENFPVKEGLMTSLDEALGTEEIDEIISRSSSANKKPKSTMHMGMYKKRHTREYPLVKNFHGTPQKSESYLLVDGYNVIFAWDDLKQLANENLDAAKDSLLELLCGYQAAKGVKIIAVFDAYKVKGHSTEYLDYKNIHVVYTKEVETADRYIERFAHDNGKKYDITVVTSDGLEQIIIRGAGCRLLSSREFKIELDKTLADIKNLYENRNKDTAKSYIGEVIYNKMSIDNLK